MKYPKLGEKFCEWYEKEFTDVVNKWYGTEISEDMLTELELTFDEYFAIYIKPYLNLPEKYLNITLDVLISHLQDKLTPQPSPYCLSFKLVLSPKINALGWLLVHIADLKYFEFNDFVKSKYRKPYNQCIICGKPDFYEREMTEGGKKLKFEFSSKKKYCHVLDCSEDSSNPSEHVNGCHYKEWAYIKKSMNQKLSRCLKRLKKLETKNISNKQKKEIDDEHIEEKIKQLEVEFYEIFENFYKKQYEKNLEIFYTVRPENFEVFDLREF